MIRDLSPNWTPGRVRLLDNYPPDHQQSMARFADCMEEGLRGLAVPFQSFGPRPRFHCGGPANRGVGKWLGYLDKYLLFRARLRRMTFAPGEIVHICDHSNAMYGLDLQNVPVVVTCHDMLAVRGAMGEVVHCPASAMGKHLQNWIVRGLAMSDAVVCVTEATRRDLDRLIPSEGQQRSVAYNPLNRPYHPISEQQWTERLATLCPGLTWGAYVLNVGSSLPRKNREGVIESFARISNCFKGHLVFAGAPLSTSHRESIEKMGLQKRVIELTHVTDDQLEALYGGAHALLFPSRAEGFGWPVIEAQACDCPVITSTLTSLPEVAGQGALMHDPEDHDAYAESLLKLLEPEVRNRWILAGRANLERFTLAGMMEVYLEVYRHLCEASP